MPKLGTLPVEILQPLAKPVEDIAMNMLQSAIISAVRKLLRSILAIVIVLIPGIIQAFQAGSASEDLITKGVFGLIVSGLVALLAFLERIMSTPKPATPPPNAKPTA